MKRIYILLAILIPGIVLGALPTRMGSVVIDNYMYPIANDKNLGDTTHRWAAYLSYLNGVAVPAAGYLGTSLSTGYVYIGNGSSTAEARVVSGDATLSQTGDLQIAAGAIVNSDVNSSAGITYPKLNLSNSILNADINSSAGITYPKLNLAGSILNADISTNASVAYTKLNLTGNVTNADIIASAGIPYTKLNIAGSVKNADIEAAAGIVDTKLATISTAGKVSNSATTATSANTASAIVARDASGNTTVNLLTNESVMYVKYVGSLPTPAANYLTIGVKSDDKLYKKNSAGTEVEIASSGSGSGVGAWQDADAILSYTNVGTVSVEDTFYRCISTNAVQFRGFVTNGTIVADNFSVDFTTFTIDSTKYHGGAYDVVGRLYRLQAGTGTEQGLKLFFDGSDTNSIYLNSDGSADPMNKTDSNTLGTGEDWVFDFEVAITGTCS